MTTPAYIAESSTPRERLISVTLDLVAAEGIESLSLRRIARRAGVSHGAPLRHFESLADLLAEVAAHGFRLLSAAIEAGVAKTNPEQGALPRLREAGAAYIRLAVENPDLFALMFRPDWLRDENSRLQADSTVAFEHLLRQVRASQDAGWNTHCDTRLLASVIWSNVHGLASLWSQGALVDAAPNASLEDTIGLSLTLLLSSNLPNDLPDNRGTT